jgi:hypothetical protein
VRFSLSQLLLVPTQRRKHVKNLIAVLAALALGTGAAFAQAPAPKGEAKGEAKAEAKKADKAAKKKAGGKSEDKKAAPK